VPVIGLVTVNCPLTTTGAGEFVAQPAGAASSSWIVECKTGGVGGVLLELVVDFLLFALGGKKLSGRSFFSLPSGHPVWRSPPPILV
jgi:hypothetical protein